MKLALASSPEVRARFVRASEICKKISSVVYKVELYESRSEMHLNVILLTICKDGGKVDLHLSHGVKLTARLHFLSRKL